MSYPARAASGCAATTMKCRALTSCLRARGVADSGAGCAHRLDAKTPTAAKTLSSRRKRGIALKGITHPLTPALSPASAGERELYNSPPRNDDAAALARHLEHQLVHAADESGGVFELSALGEERLVEEEVAPIGEARFFLVQTLHHRVRGIDLEDRLRLRRFLPDRLEDAGKVASHVVLVGDQARGRMREARGHAHVLHPVAEHILQFRNQRAMLPDVPFVFLFLLLGLDLAEVKLAFRDRDELFALVFREIRDQPLVDALRQEQHLDRALAEDLKVGAVLRGEEGLRGHVVDLVLPSSARGNRRETPSAPRFRYGWRKSAGAWRCARGWRSPRTPSFSTRPNS